MEKYKIQNRGPKISHACVPRVTVYHAPLKTKQL